jgi:PAS domain S-box-containing protein
MKSGEPEAVDIDAVQFSRTLRQAILLPVCAILLTSLVLLVLGFEFLEVVKKTDHSRQVELQMQRCEELLLSAEGSVRGYLLQGDPIFLDSYNASLATLDGDFLKLKNLVAGNHDSRLLADQLIQSKDTWIDHARSSVAQRRQGKTPDDDWNKMGKTLMDRVRQNFTQLAQVEAQIQLQRQHSLRQAKWVTVLASSVLVILLALMVGQMVRRQFSTLAEGYRGALNTVRQRHTALSRSEVELEQQKEWFRVTLSSIGDGVIVTDREGRVVFMNREAERLTGWTAVEALLNPLPSVFRLIDEATRDRMENPVSQVFAQQKVVDIGKQALLIGRHGQEWPIEDTAAPILNGEGQMLGVVLVFHDATDIRSAQRALEEHSEELERKVDERTATLRQAVADLEAFSYTVSHDLRSPLRAMQGFAEAVLEDYGTKIDEQGRDYLVRIKNAAQRLDRLIQDLLSFTRLSRQDVPLVELDLDRMTREIIEHYPNLHRPAAEVTIEGTLPHVMGQEAALTQVLSNLLGNAVKFVKAGTTPQVRIWADERADRVRLWIEDNGIGIAPGDVDRIFSMFVRVNESSAYGGTGVGLAIVKKAVDTMQGTVGNEPAPQGGTRFWVELRSAKKALEKQVSTSV